MLKYFSNFFVFSFINLYQPLPKNTVGSWIKSIMDILICRNATQIDNIYLNAFAFRLRIRVRGIITGLVVPNQVPFGTRRKERTPPYSVSKIIP